MGASQEKFNDLKRRAAGFETTIDAHIEAAEQEARERANAILEQAKQEASAVRAEAQALVEDARAKVTDLMRLRQALFASLRDTLNDFGHAVEHSEEDRAFTELLPPPPEPAAANPEPPQRGGAESSPAAAPAADAVQGTGSHDAAQAAGASPGPQPPSPLPPGAFAVEVHVESLTRVEAAQDVERAFSRLPATQQARLLSFEGQVAVIEAAGTDVNTLIRSMRSYFPFPFILREAKPGKLTIQVGDTTS